MSKRPREAEGAGDSSGVVEFNVGGRIFAAARTTLCSYPSSMLARMFSESDAIGHTRDSMGRIFLCRDPDIFVHVLAYLRNSRLVCPLTSCDIVRDHSHSELDHYRSYTYVETPKCLAVTKQPIPDPAFLQMADAEADYLGLDSMRADIARVARRMPAKFWFDRGCKVELMKAWGYDAGQLAGVESTNASFPADEIFVLCVAGRVLPVGPGKIPYEETTYAVALGGPAKRGTICVVVHDEANPSVTALMMSNSPFSTDPGHSIGEFTGGVRYLRFEDEGGSANNLG